MSGVIYGESGADAPAGPTLRHRLKAGETAYGASCSLGSPFIAEIMVRAGLDYIYIDQQHGLTSFDTLVHMLRAIDHTPTAAIVRVLSNDAGLIGQVLDAGADGVIVPMVNSVEDARRAAAACRYAPLGQRSFGAFRASMTRGSDIHQANERVMCFAMIESEAGLRAADDIAAVPGVDGIYIGQADLAVSLGLPSQVRIQPGKHQNAVDAIMRACKTAGIVVGLSGHPVEMRDAGFRLITMATDRSMIEAGVKDLKAKMALARG
ncbi:HpcH/HpaI aldolase family protein [Falsiroseomonas sp. HW251]|uniref:HpcH/HpaI aldolase family protein n=1 Tax=Falsiroseomonas sp. HW251 TaxID=3390998 RepID=UPI003D32421A